MGAAAAAVRWSYCIACLEMDLDSAFKCGSVNAHVALAVVLAVHTRVQQQRFMAPRHDRGGCITMTAEHGQHARTHATSDKYRAVITQP